jgi:hypothetical protein
MVIVSVLKGRVEALAEVKCVSLKAQCAAARVGWLARGGFMVFTSKDVSHVMSGSSQDDPQGWNDWRYTKHWQPKRQFNEAGIT